MATWTVSLDRPVAVESPNAVAYVTYASDDSRTIAGVRVPYAAESDLLDFLARECARLAALDDRNAEMAQVVATATVAPGPLSLPDISKQQAAKAANDIYQQKLNAALAQKVYEEAVTFDPTVADAKAASDAAQAVAAKS